MNCYNCGEVLKKKDTFCPKCGANNVQVQKKKQFPFVPFSIGFVIFAAIFYCILPCSYMLNKAGFFKTNKLIGEWSTERGMDSSYLTFKKDGTLIEKVDMFDTNTYDYSLRGDVLFVDDEEYTYSEAAKDYDFYNNYWYIDDDVLYFDGRTYYRQKD